MRVIGFTTKYYTLWEVDEHIEETKYGRYKVVNHAYLKNISYDLKKVQEKYPDVPIDYNLKGHTSWRSGEWVERYAVDEFKCGKYAGEKISECTDLSYLSWAWNQGNVVPYESREIAINVLENNGYRLINESYLATPNEVAKIEASFDETDEAMKTIEETGKLIISSPKNLAEDGTLTISHIELSFPEYKELEYGGYYYGLPINSKGQAKRIKNKELTIIPESYEIEISEYGWGATLKIVVKDFEITK